VDALRPRAPADSDGGYRGKVLDEKGHPVPGATVAILEPDETNPVLLVLMRDGRAAHSGPDGRFRLRPAPLFQEESRRRSLVARCQGFESARAALPAAPDEEVVLVLKEGLSVSGRVCSALTSEGVGGVRVVARGVGAFPAAGDPLRFASLEAETQSCETKADGSFEVRGLREGVYEIEPVAPGIVALPSGATLYAILKGHVGPDFATAAYGKARYPKDRGLFARAGEAGVRLQVVPLAAILIRAVDAKSGQALPQAFLGVARSPDYDLWPAHVSTDDLAVVVNGRSVDMQAATLAQGTLCRYLLPRRFPLAGDAKAVVTVMATGFRPKKLSVPLVALGRAELRPAVVALDETEPHGTVRFRLRDLDGHPVGPVRCRAMIVRRDAANVVCENLRFDNDGDSGLCAMPVGSHRMRSVFGRAPVFRGREFVVEAERTREVPLTLEGGGFTLEVVNREGNPVEDYGFRAEPGVAGIRQKVRAEGGGVKVTGIWWRRPGLGRVEPIVYTGLNAGAWRIEVFRHGYAPATAALEIRPGYVARHVRLVLDPDPLAKWDTWIEGD